jgi:hypothetical protein
MFTSSGSLNSYKPQRYLKIFLASPIIFQWQMIQVFWHQESTHYSILKLSLINDFFYPALCKLGLEILLSNTLSFPWIRGKVTWIEEEAYKMDLRGSDRKKECG